MDLNSINTTNTVNNITYTTDAEQTQLTNDDFLNMFLTELKYQDPMEPMDATKMLDSTLQMSTIESQTKQTESLQNIENSFLQKNSIDFVSAIGKKIKVNDGSVNFVNGLGNFEFYNDKNIDNGYIKIFDNNQTLLGEIEINDLESGLNSINLSEALFDDYKNLNGNYNIEITAYDEAGMNLNIIPGEFPITGVNEINGNIFFKTINNKSIQQSDITEYKI